MTTSPAARPTEDESVADDVTYLAALGDRLRQLRILRDMSQDELAQAAGLSRSVVSHVESGAVGIGLLRLLALARALRVAVAELLPDTAPPHVDTGGPMSALDAAVEDRAAEGAYRREVGRRAKAQRIWLNLTQDDVAGKTGLTRNYVSAVERGQQSLDAHRLMHLARALDTTLGWLLADPDYHRRNAPYDDR